MSTNDEQFTGYRTNHPDDIAHFASVRSFQDFLVDKTNPVVMVTLTINDKGFLDNATFETHLTQHTNAHDEFTIIVNDTAIDDFKGQVMKNSKDLLGENITIHFHQFGSVIYSFKGIIANICNKKNEGGGYGTLHISGYAPSIVLDGGKTCQSYENKTLPEIIAEATAEYPQESQIHIDGLINNEEKIPYTVQYNESDYQFIQRLARRYGEFFYYNGTQYIFGSRAQQTVTLYEGGDLSEVEFELMLKPQKFNYLSYNSQMTRTEVKGSEQTEPQYKENPFQFAAIQASEKVFAKTTDQTYGALPDEFRGDYLKEAVQREKEKREQLMQVRGKSRNPHVRIGGFVKLKDINDLPMETYRVIDVTHYQGEGDYYNEFIAIPDVFVAYYYDEQALPRAEQQPARVIDNNDPEGWGRVRVQFIWQEKHQTKTPWIRVVQPHAGGGKGFYFIPEIGEEVWVDFEDQNAERPFVVGSNYNGKEYSPFHNTNNDIKAIQTRSGVKIKINDSNGSLFLEDPSGNNIYMDGKQKISFNGATLEFNAQRIIMNATERTEITTNDYILNALSKIYVFSTWFKQQINGFMHLFSNSALINTTNAIDIEAKEAKLLGTEKSIVHSDNVAVVNSLGTAELKGKQGNKYTQKAEEVSSTPAEEIGLAVVHFRPLDTWRGEFGFDWLRVNDGAALTKEKPYEEIIEGGYGNGIVDLTRGATGTACLKLKTQYHQHCIKRKDITNTNTEYFVPYLSLFSKEFVDKLATSPNRPVILPQYEAEIQLLIEIEENIDKLEFEYNKDIFKLDKNVLSNKTVTSLTKGETIKITCLKDLDSDKEIKIYAYPKIDSSEPEMLLGSESQAVEEQDFYNKLESFLNRKLAGKIIILQNDSRVRKEKKFVLVPVMTNIHNIVGNDKIGSFSLIEKENLLSFLYQGLIIGFLEEGRALDLSSNRKFQIRIDSRRRKIYGDYIFKNGTPPNSKRTDGNIWEDKSGIFRYVQMLYLKENNQYKGYFTIFCFDENTYDSYNIPTTGQAGAVPGQVEKISTENVFLFNGIRGGQRKADTLPHEALHGLGLHHTHKDSTPIKEATRKYVYSNGNVNITNSTDNIMSYGNKIKKSLWRWQWHIINPNIKEK